MAATMPSDVDERLPQAATESIAHHLVAMQRPEWQGVILTWLQHYAGLEKYLWPEDAPAARVANLLERYAARGFPPHTTEVAYGLSTLAFVRLAARHAAGGPRWDALDQPFGEWAGHQEINVWEASEWGNVVDIIQTRLIVRLSQARNQ